MSGAELLFPLLSLSAAAYRAREVCSGAWYTVRLGRRVESIVSDLKVEETIYQAYRNHFALSAGLNPDQVQQRDLWCNASIRTALETRLGSSKAHALLENLRETQDSINDVYAISWLASQGLHVLRHKPDQQRKQSILDYLSHKGRRLYPSMSIEDMIQVQIKHIRNTNKTTSRLFWCPNMLGSAETAPVQLQITRSEDFEPALPSPYHTNLRGDSMSITQQLRSILSLDLFANDPKASFCTGFGNELASEDSNIGFWIQDPPLPVRLSWWKILLASPNKSFFITQFLLFILGIGVVIGWFLWKRDLGTATGCGGLVFAIGSTANMVWDKCYSKPAVEDPLSLKGSRQLVLMLDTTLKIDALLGIPPRLLYMCTDIPEQVTVF